MNSLIQLIVLSCVIVYISAAALPDEIYRGDVIDDDNDDGETDDLVNEGDFGPDLVRRRRFSCDLFSFKSKMLTPNDSVCAARCIFIGKKGGTCQNGICRCRGSWFGK